MAITKSNLYGQVIREHHARLERIAEKRGVSRLKRVYDESQAEVAAKVKKLVSGGKGSTFEAHHKRLVLAQLTHGQAYVADRLAGELHDAAKDAQHDTLRALGRDISRLEDRYTGHAPVLPLEDVARFQGVVGTRDTSLLKRHESSMNEYGMRTVVKVEDELSKSLMQGESQSEAIDRVTDAIDGEWWQGERIVRTELAWATNASQADGIRAAREVLPDLMMQWRELVSDEGEPLDDRVGEDSLALHGQLVVPGGLFTCPERAPDGQLVPDSLAMEEIAWPPNRPNDRATVAPWRADWGIPGWRFVNGRRAPM